MFQGQLGHIPFKFIEFLYWLDKFSTILDRNSKIIFSKLSTVYRSQQIITDILIYFDQFSAYEIILMPYVYTDILKVVSKYTGKQWSNFKQKVCQFYL